VAKKAPKAAKPKAKKASKPKAPKPAKKAPAAKAATPKAPPAPKDKSSKAKAVAAEPKVDKKKAAKPAPEAPKEDPKVDASKSGRKGITIVSPKPAKKAKAPSSTVSAIPAGMGRLLDPKGPARKPLIPSGPKAAAQRPLGQHGGVQNDQPRPTAKSPFSKKELEHFRAILIAKRRELFGDVSTMETQALRGQSGALSNMPQHLAEQGSEAYDQALSLDLAAADRKLIREIDDALARIADGTYGICEMSGKPIKVERLEELPWARYSIEAARELERQSMRG
jgi:DnaK suppressor protein